MIKITATNYNISIVFSAHNIIPSLELVTIIAGIVGSSRLILNAYKDADVYLGYFVGFMFQVVAFWWSF